MSVHSSNRILAEHLFNSYTEPIRDPLWKNIYISPPLRKVIAASSFQKLARIKQLGPAFLVYPGAVHTRLAHSLGVFHIARRMLISLISREDCPALTPEGAKAFLTAALLHDTGHFPFAHSLKELPLKTHEKLTGEIVQSDPVKSIIINDVGTDPGDVAAIIDLELETRNPEVGFYRQILSGVLDPDKLDYLNRDAFFCGIPYGTQDTDFILHRLIPDFQSGLSIDIHGISAVENLLFSKYLMYRSVYWHRAVRIATAMIKQAVIISLKNGTIKNSDLYGLDDDQFNRLFEGKEKRIFQLIEQVGNRNLYKTVFETDFDRNNPDHVKLLDQENRYRISERAAGILSSKYTDTVYPENVIIDIPEPISFEIDLPIVDSNKGIISFREADSVFKPPVIEGFTSSLRKIRLFLPEKHLPLTVDPRELIFD